MADQLMDSETSDTNDIVYSPDDVESDSRECLNVISELSSADEQKSEQNDRRLEIIGQRFDVIVKKYQSNPKLIECHLNGFLTPIIDIVTKSQLNGKRFNAGFQLIQRLAQCVRPKTIARYFPTEVLWVPKLIDWCERQSAEDSTTWETRSVLLLWLSMAVKTPFHLKKFDSQDTDGGPDSTANRIYGIIGRYLNVSDSAALLAASFLSRSDIVGQQLLDRFMSEALTQIASLSSEPSGNYIQSHFGHAIAVAVLFKVAERHDMSQFAARVIDIGTQLDTCGHELIAKWKVKLIGRSALSLMTPRIAKWRYQRGRRLLSQNILSQMSDEKQPSIGFEKKESVDESEDDSDFSDIPEQIEVIIDSLLNGLHDPNTTVRWSAAKYVARLTNRLPKELAAEVVSHVLQLCEWKDSDSSWHGCCLALAELARRGLILAQQLPDIIDVTEKALLFDEMKGAISVGSNVRDAACYVCWSLSRAYESHDIERFVHQLAPTLVCVTCFDREVNCRRAASAAIQELGGRTNVFPHGLEVIVLTDFHSLAIRSHCYLEIARALAEKEEFGHRLVEHLVEKCQHWDRELRELVAPTLGRLSAVIDMNRYLPELLPKTTSLDLNSRHGSILAIAHIIGNIGHKISAEFVPQIESIASILSEKKLLRGMGGEFMKAAISVLIEKCSAVVLPIGDRPKVFGLWIDLLCESIASKDAKTQSAAVTAVPMFCEHYLSTESVLKNRILNELLRHLESSDESARVGAAESLRLMSAQTLDTEYFDKCFAVFISHIESTDQLCNSRAKEVLALVESVLKRRPISGAQREQIVHCLCRALNDRTTSSRGDIGGCVRLAAIDAVLLFVDQCSDEQIVNILKIMISQCVSIWLRERTLAAGAFKQITFDKDLPSIDRQIIRGLFAETAEEVKDDENEKTSADLKAFIRLLSVESFTYDLWRGLVRFVAVPSETRARHLLRQELKRADGRVFDEFLRLFSDNGRRLDPLAKFCIDCSHFLLISCRTEPEFRAKVLTLTWNCVRKVKDCRKIVSAIDVFCAAIQLDDTYRPALSYLTAFLCHSYPRIRSQTAIQTHLALLTIDDISEDVISLLSDTDWNQPSDRLRPVRERICDALGVRPAD